MALATIPAGQPTDGFGNLPSQMTLGSTGIVLHADNDFSTDAYGVQWGINPTSMMGNQPNPRDVVGDSPYSDGQWNGTTNWGPRTFTIPGRCDAPDHLTLHQARQRLSDACSLQPFQLLISEPGYEGYVYARRTGDIQWSENRFDSSASFTITLIADRPRVISSQTRTFALTLGGNGGLDWTDPGSDWTDPGSDWSDSGGANTAQLVNPSPVLSVPLLLNLSAPIVGALVITLQQGSTAQVMRLFNGDPAGGDLLVTGQTLRVDSGRHGVWLNNASRRYWRSGAWLLVPPGTSTIYATGSGAGSVAGSFAAARI